MSTVLPAGLTGSLSAGAAEFPAAGDPVLAHFRLTALADPMAVLFIASVVGLVVVSLVLAMTSLYDVAL